MALNQSCSVDSFAPALMACLRNFAPQRPIGPSNSNVALLFFSSSLSARHARQISGAWRQRRATASGFDPCALALAREVTHRPPPAQPEKRISVERKGETGRARERPKQFAVTFQLEQFAPPSQPSSLAIFYVIAIPLSDALAVWSRARSLLPRVQRAAPWPMNATGPA